jgi:hypothetical protein
LSSLDVNSSLLADDEDDDELNVDIFNDCSCDSVSMPSLFTTMNEFGQRGTLFDLPTSGG